MAARNRRKALPRKKPRRWLIPKLFLLLGIGGLTAFIVAIFVMEAELNRIGFFTKVTRPASQSPLSPAKESSAASPVVPPSRPSQGEPPQPDSSRSPGSVSAPEDMSREERKQSQDLTTARSTENLSQDDRKRLEDVLRSR